MGLLDDAIREHLELKRRLGADPEDLQRQEREALGPVVRADELATDVASGETDEVSSEYEPDGGDLVDAYDHEFEPFSEPAAHPSAHAEPEPVAEGDRPLDEEQLEAWPSPEPEPSPHAGQPTEEFDVEAVHREEARRRPPEPPEPPERPERPEHPERKSAEGAAPQSEGEHDVLEDTPDFLQETPEHDRLWFEQAPPQDFDFDK